MKTFKVASDSSCLIALSQINLFHLLKELFLELYIPPSVYDEVVIKGEGEAGSKETESAVKDGLILKKAVKDSTAISALITTLLKPSCLCHLFIKLTLMSEEKNSTFISLILLPLPFIRQVYDAAGFFDVLEGIEGAF